MKAKVRIRISRNRSFPPSMAASFWGDAFMVPLHRKFNDQRSRSCQQTDGNLDQTIWQ